MKHIQVVVCLMPADELCASTSAVAVVKINWCHNNDIIMGMMGSQITGVSIVYSTIGSGADRRKHQSSPWLAFVRGIHQWLVNSPHKGPVTQKMFPFGEVSWQDICSIVFAVAYACYNHSFGWGDIPLPISLLICWNICNHNCSMHSNVYPTYNEATESFGPVAHTYE